VSAVKRDNRAESKQGCLRRGVYKLKMGLNWQFTIWREKFSVAAEQLVFILLADRTPDASNEYEFSFDELMSFLPIESERHLRRILQKYDGDLINYSAGKGRGNKSKIVWLINPKQRIVKAIKGDIKEDTQDRFSEIKGDIKGDIKEDTQVQNSPTPPIRNINNKTQLDGEYNARPPARRLSVDEVLEIEAELETKEQIYQKNEFLPKSVEIYFEIFPNHQLDGENLKDFCNRLPEVEESVWRQTLLDWRLARYKASNIPGMISRYLKDLKEKHEENGGSKNGRSKGYYPDKNDKFDAGLDELANDPAFGFC